jgi:hypothetical protein
MVDTMHREPQFVMIAEVLFRFSFFMIFFIPWTGLIGGFISMVILGNTFSPAETEALKTAFGIMFIPSMLAFIVSGLIVTEYNT